MDLKTEIKAEFIPAMPPTKPADLLALQQLNADVDAVCEDLQDTFRGLIIKMLALKRGTT